MPRPIGAADSVFLEELTWLEVRDALRAGKTTALVASGGVEMNGPYLATGKHNYVLRATTDAIARKLGNALVAPIVPFVPEGAISPPTSHMRYPGTISVRETTFEALLTDIAASLKQHGFREIYFIADSGGNVKGMRAVAQRLNTRWKAHPRVHYIAAYYDNAAVHKWVESQGIHQIDEEHHDDYPVTAQLMTLDPKLVRLPQRIAAGKASINGVALTPADRNIAMGRRIVDFRAQTVVNAIRSLRGTKN